MITIHNQFVNVTDLTAAVESSFKQADDQINRRKSKPHRVKVNGKYIITDSNKTVWPSIGAAKNAIRNHIGNSMAISNWVYAMDQNKSPFDRLFSSTPLYSDIKDEIIKVLESNKIIVYVPYTDGE